jgi:hypothetical protein
MNETGTTIKHYGVKGMKWGVRKAETGSPSQTPSKPPVKLSDDVRAAVNAQRKITETGGTHSLSNQELQGLLTRMNLERQYSAMMSGSQSKSSMERGHTQVKKYLAYGETIEKVRKFMDTDTGKMVKTGLNTAASAGLAYATGGTSAAVAAGAGTIVRRSSR